MTKLNYGVKVEGLPELFRDLGRIDPELRKAAVRRVYAVGQIIQTEARGNIPAMPPMSGWQRRRGARNKWAWSPARSRSRIRVKVSTGSVKKNEIRLIRVIQSDPAGSIYDMAGRKSSGKSQQGRQFVQNLNKRGKASRSMWAAAEAKESQIEQALREAVDDMADTVNRRLR